MGAGAAAGVSPWATVQPPPAATCEQDRPTLLPVMYKSQQVKAQEELLFLQDILSESLLLILNSLTLSPQRMTQGL